MPKALKIFTVIILSLITLGFIAFFIIDKPEPDGHNSMEANNWAQQITQDLNQSAWDSTRYVKWTFKGIHHFLWDKQANQVRVRWDEYEVHLDPENNRGVAYRAGIQLTEEASVEAIQMAENIYYNDGFWLYAHYKLMDPGTKRTIVEDKKDGSRGLKVTYTSGGVTPGDTYLWFFDPSNKPTHYKVWVDILPIGGLCFTWEDWIQTATGAWLPQKHQIGSLTLELDSVQTAMRLAEMNESEWIQQ